MSAALAFLVWAAAPGGSIDVPEYRDRLRAIQAAIDQEDVSAARFAARGLQLCRIRQGSGDLPPDPTVLGPLAVAKDLAAAREASLRLKALIDALDASPDAPASPGPDRALLERLRREEAERPLARGGPAGGPGLHAPSWEGFRIRSLWEWIQSASESVGRFCMRILYWLFRLLVGSAGANSAGVSTRYLVGALVLTVLGGLGLVAVLALRRSRREAAPEARSEAPARSERDDDPLSRTASEWERFALELMNGGRFREAIRAWYHAVLVTLFRAGALNYRKDRTNWEYAYALPASAAWRPSFLEATRTFEQEWYGWRNTAVETAQAYQAHARSILQVVREGAGR